MNLRMKGWFNSRPMRSSRWKREKKLGSLSYSRWGTFTATGRLPFCVSSALSIVPMPLRLRTSVIRKRPSNMCPGWNGEKGLALIPIKIYLKNGRIKCEIAVAKGKKLHDKRETERAKTAEAEARAEMRRRA